MDTIRKGWFTEFSPNDLLEYRDNKTQFHSDQSAMGEAWPGQAFSLHIDQILFHEKSKFQDVLVFKSTNHGNVLVLDDVIQCTERDEFAYQEMLAHLPMCAHPNPREVLIIGGGDGGILREVLKHASVERVTMCEIDDMVVDVAKKYLSNMASAFQSEKLELHIGDGLKFLKENKNKFDVVITDSSDPIGPAETLFGENYYKMIKEALKDDGVLASQAESVWLHLDLIQHMMSFSRNLFPSVAYANGLVSTYPTGIIGYLLCSKTEKIELRKPIRALTKDQVKSMTLRYYNSKVHEAAFVLPQFAALELKQD